MPLNDLINPGAAPMLDNPRNQLLFDCATEHRKVIHGAFMHAVQEMTGKPIDPDDMRINAGIESFDHLGWVDYLYKKRVVLRVWMPVIQKIENGKTRVFQRVEELWKRKGRGRT